MSVKTRIAELNTRLAETLTEKGVAANASETTTALIDKVGEIPQGGMGLALPPEFFQDSKTPYYVDITADMLEGVTTLRKAAFQYWYINSIELPNTLTTIAAQHIFSGAVFPDDYVFVLPDSITSTTGTYALAITSVGTVDLGNGLNTLGSYAMAGSGVNTVIFGTNFKVVANTTVFSTTTKLKNLIFRAGATVDAQSGGISFNVCPLTAESVDNLINVLVDRTGQTAMTLTLKADVKANLTDAQIATITNKNWTLA